MKTVWGGVPLFQCVCMYIKAIIHYTQMIFNTFIYYTKKKKQLLKKHVLHTTLFFSCVSPSKAIFFRTKTFDDFGKKKLVDTWIKCLYKYNIKKRDKEILIWDPSVIACHMSKVISSFRFGIIKIFT